MRLGVFIRGGQLNAPTEKSAQNIINWPEATPILPYRPNQDGDHPFFDQEYYFMEVVPFS